MKRLSIILLVACSFNACTISREGIAFGDTANKLLNERIELRGRLERLSDTDRAKLTKLVEDVDKQY